MGVAQPEGSRLARGMAERGGAGLMGAQHARQATIAGHANYCKTEVVVGELPSGCVDMSSKPDRCDSKYEAGEAGDTAWQADLRVWEKRNIAGQVRQQRAEAAYEHTAGRISAWLREQGHPAFAEWVRGVDGLASLRLVTMDNGCPCPPTVEHVLDWAFSFAKGLALKGGSKEYRSGWWYAKVNGKTQAEVFMSGPAKAYGYGAYADCPPAFTYIEQALSRLRHWLKRQLRES